MGAIDSVAVMVATVSPAVTADCRGEGDMTGNGVSDALTPSAAASEPFPGLRQDRMSTHDKKRPQIAHAHTHTKQKAQPHLTDDVRDPASASTFSSLDKSRDARVGDVTWGGIVAMTVSFGAGQ